VDQVTACAANKTHTEPNINYVNSKSDSTAHTRSGD